MRVGDGVRCVRVDIVVELNMLLLVLWMVVVLQITTFRCGRDRDGQ